ncbi:luciferase family oxidoreductase, group 1 [Chitinophaga terrae (ex Kim and Jung 2007)]|uniref:Luciferase-like monooxygenase n=1 Tax=Chitinophaga terrae (ex Kim and Jung 2007) TaxID=408074 RepID=A0A1H4D4I4_9BACT|nr:LLM class flavin-dependent oxidoreductase [Chitinophaga terrae (ex Kim and Jung 2007)]GEP90548.1 luciferase-like monooxygenase [Chitinophaga terrae (ex Kim and Jung 2007)]SEA67733.1 luciferase family oxidoreductase, group 1 [Chitinophaga terrae (ex Kim and Jung 2007)]
MNTTGINRPLSVLDLATVLEGQTPADAFHNSLRLAQHVEKLGYKRFWMAEHHSMISVASSATAVLLGYIAGGTKTIRVGSGGVMLPNHAPLVVAEQFGTLESLYPGRIDLGLGRAPGTDQITARALRRDHVAAAHEFPEQIQELQHYLSADNTGPVRAVPGEGLDIPIWILGSSTDSAYLAAVMGLPYAFASHFAPAQLHAALKIYRQQFKPSEYLDKPYTMACVNVIAADTDAEANRLATSFYQMFLGVIRGKLRKLPPPVDSMDGIWNEYEYAHLQQMLTCTFIGSKATVDTQIRQFIDVTAVDEIIVTANVYDQDARLKSYELLRSLFA